MAVRLCTDRADASAAGEPASSGGETAALSPRQLEVLRLLEDCQVATRERKDLVALLDFETLASRDFRTSASRSR